MAVSNASTLEEERRKLTEETAIMKKALEESRREYEKNDSELQQILETEKRIIEQLFKQRDTLCRKLRQEKPWLFEPLDVNGVPKKYLCPITGKIMKEPCYHPTSLTNYDYHAIVANTSWNVDGWPHPATGVKVKLIDFKKNEKLKSEIEKYNKVTEAEIINGRMFAESCLEHLKGPLDSQKAGGKRKNKSKRRNKSKRKNKSKRTKKRKKR